MVVIWTQQIQRYSRKATVRVFRVRILALGLGLGFVFGFQLQNEAK